MSDAELLEDKSSLSWGSRVVPSGWSDLPHGTSGFNYFETATSSHRTKVIRGRIAFSSRTVLAAHLFACKQAPSRFVWSRPLCQWPTVGTSGPRGRACRVS